MENAINRLNLIFYFQPPTAYGIEQNFCSNENPHADRRGDLGQMRTEAVK
jgi:hypothetical protein